MSTLLNLIRLLFPPQPFVRAQDKIIGGIGAFVGVLGLFWASHYFTPHVTLLVVASMAASAVLFFAAPHSPLAQPWAFAGGHLLSALIGVSCYQWIPDTFIAAATAVSLAILTMHFLHCLHPPGGATAFIAVMGGDAVYSLEFGYVLAPVGLNVAVFLVMALLVNNLFIPRRSYPSRTVRASVSKSASAYFDVERKDLEDALREIGGYIDVSVDDLEEINAFATLHARRRQLEIVKVSDIMQRDVPSCEYGDELEVIWEHMRSDRNKGVPIIDRAGHVVGIVTIVDFLKRVEGRASGTPIERLALFIRRTPGMTSDKPEVVGQIMTSPAITVCDDAHIDTLIPLFAEDKIHHLPVVDANQRLVGMVTQSDLLASLYRRRAI